MSTRGTNECTALGDERVKPKLLVAVVLYQARAVDVVRQTAAVRIAAQHAVDAGVLSQVVLSYGDCGSPPLHLNEMSLPEGIAVEYLDFEANLGHSEGSNRLFAEAGWLDDSDLVVFLNPDAIPEERAFTHLVKALEPGNVGVVDGRQIPFEHPKSFDPMTGEQSWASGACLGVRSSVFQRLAGFDADLFWSYCNDVDLSWRARHLGLMALHIPQAVFFHDKRVDENGHVIATQTQVYYSTLARLNLGVRYGRGDVVAQTVRWVERDGSVDHRRAVRDFRLRDLTGPKISPLPGAEDVAVFENGEYAHHRF